MAKSSSNLFTKIRRTKRGSWEMWFSLKRHTNKNYTAGFFFPDTPYIAEKAQTQVITSLMTAFHVGVPQSALLLLSPPVLFLV